ncbi:MAG: hypothetical protein HZB53_13895 [Chloroflexi bacterium]|nr:hypothetical protein [Chloroflexota bacterium]
MGDPKHDLPPARIEPTRAPGATGVSSGAARSTPAPAANGGAPLFGALLGRALGLSTYVPRSNLRTDPRFQAFVNLDASGPRRFYQPALKLPGGGYAAPASASQPAARAPGTAALAALTPASIMAALADIAPIAAPAVVPAPIASGSAMALADYPRPPADSGRGMHWVPTTHSAPDVVDRFVKEMRDMRVSWAVFLNDGANIGDNDYLVQQLVKNGIMPVLRVHTTGLSPVDGDLTAMVKHYKAMGVSYFQLYNEPNLKFENNGHAPDVKRYLDAWSAAAKAVVAGGGLPGFGSLSPQGDVDDKQFLRQSLDALRARGESSLLDTAWLSLHNYGANYLQFRDADAIVRGALGRALPVISTEGGIYPGKSVTPDEQVRIVTDAYRYLRKREPNYFAYTYWIIANEEGGGRDRDFTAHALFQPGGTSPIVKALQQMDV